MEKEMKIIVPKGCVVERIKVIDASVAVITFKEKKRKLPKSWEEFSQMFPVPFAFRPKCDPFDGMRITTQVNIQSIMADFTDNPEISDALIALIKLILLRDCYNGGWKPDWDNYNQEKYTIEFHGNEIFCDTVTRIATILYFKTEELRDEFLRCFQPLIEKLKPLYGII